MNGRVKRICALLLTFALLFSAAGLCFSEAASADPCPVVIARGMDFNRLYTNYGSPAVRPLFHGVTAAGIVKTLASAMKNAGDGGFNHALAVAAVDFAREILGDMACDNKGESVQNVGYAKYDCSVAESPALQALLMTSPSQEEALVRAGVKVMYHTAPSSMEKRHGA